MMTFLICGVLLAVLVALFWATFSRASSLERRPAQVLLPPIALILSVVLLALFNAAMHSINQMQTVMVPSYFKNTGNVSLISGVLNSSTYIGSSLSIYGIALISERSGWGITLLLWAIVALAGTALCLAIFRPWDRYVKKLEKETV